MNQTVLALLVGLAAGVCGALLGGFASRSDGGGRSVPLDLSSIERRLDAIEARLGGEGLRLAHATELRGRADDAANRTSGLEVAGLADALAARLEERMEDSVREAVRTTWKEMADEGALPPGAEATSPVKQKVTLAEAAVELELSAAEETELRRVHEESIQKFLEAVADEEAGVEGVKRDLEEAKADPSKRASLMTKYIGRVMSNLGEVIVIGTEHDRKIVELIGADKAERLENEFQLTDVDPYDLEGVFEGGFGK